jgi:Transposase
MKSVRYPAEFKAEAVRQVNGRGHGVVDVAKRLGVSDKSFYPASSSRRFSCRPSYRPSFVAATEFVGQACIKEDVHLYADACTVRQCSSPSIVILK